MIRSISFLLLTLILNAASLHAIAQDDPGIKLKQDSIIEKYAKQGAWRYSYFSPEWQQNLDKGLEQDSTIAYLWQQKAMPYFKRRKYSVGMKYLDKAVHYDKKLLDYRAFIKCIFSKDYEGGIVDFKEASIQNPNGRIMDHSYLFYIALCYLQTDRFMEAKNLLLEDMALTEKENGKDWIHFMDLFYLGIAHYELGEYKEALVAFEKVLKTYTNFSDAQYFKGKVLMITGDEKAGREWMLKAKANFEKGYTINEDNAIYEPYPYQVNWKLVKL